MEPKQKQFIGEWKSNGYIISDAADATGISRQTHYDWLRDSAEYKAEFEAAFKEEFDFVEGALKKKIKSGDTAAIIFTLKTRFKAMGYGEVVEHRGQGTAGEIVFRLDYGNTDADASGH